MPGMKRFQKTAEKLGEGTRAHGGRQNEFRSRQFQRAAQTKTQLDVRSGSLCETRWNDDRRRPRDGNADAVERSAGADVKDGFLVPQRFAHLAVNLREIVI